MKNTLENRLANVRRSIADQNLDAFMVLIEENRRYLSGFTGEDTQFDESAGALFITDDRLLLATDSRYRLQAEQEAPLFDVYCYPKGLAESLPDIVKSLNAKRIGFESIRLSYGQYQRFLQELQTGGLDAQLTATQDIVETFRIVKEEPEIEAISSALSIAEAAFERMVPAPVSYTHLTLPTN